LALQRSQANYQSLLQSIQCSDKNLTLHNVNKAHAKLAHPQKILGMRSCN